MRRFTMKCLSITIACLCISMGSIAPKEFTDAKNSKAARAGVCCVLSNNLIIFATKSALFREGRQSILIDIILHLKNSGTFCRG